MSALQRTIGAERAISVFAEVAGRDLDTSLGQQARRSCWRPRDLPLGTVDGRLLPRPLDQLRSGRVPPGNPNLSPEHAAVPRVHLHSGLAEANVAPISPLEVSNHTEIVSLSMTHFIYVVSSSVYFGS